MIVGKVAIASTKLWGRNSTHRAWRSSCAEKTPQKPYIKLWITSGQVPQVDEPKGKSSTSQISGSGSERCCGRSDKRPFHYWLGEIDVQRSRSSLRSGALQCESDLLLTQKLARARRVTRAREEVALRLVAADGTQVGDLFCRFHAFGNRYQSEAVR